MCLAAEETTKTSLELLGQRKGTEVSDNLTWPLLVGINLMFVILLDIVNLELTLSYYLGNYQLGT